MAVLNGKLYFSWVQHSYLCIPDLTSISANSNGQLAKSALSHWLLALGQIKAKICPSVFLGALCGRWFSFAMEEVRR
jgi:hypothetical protein